jgi:predicted lysophospholipase L1 biosynthesis ABC-type transport system permease subunit
VVNCADLTANPGLGVCAPGARTGQIEVGLLGSKFVPHGGWLPSTYSPSQLAALPVGALAVTTDGSDTAIEQVRTLLEHALPYPSAQRYPPLTIAENSAHGDDAKRNAAYQRLADVVILATLPIAGCTLAVGIIAGLNDRRRPFGLLRLTGAPVGLLRRVILLESAVPLLAGAVAALGVGFLTSYLFLRAQLSETLHSPGPGFYAVVLAGVVASLAVVASTFPVLRRLTGPEAVRND